MRADQLYREILDDRVGSRALPSIPGSRDGELLRRSRVRDLTHLGQGSEVFDRAECRWWCRPELVARGEEERPRAKIPARDWTAGPQPVSRRRRGCARIGESNEVGGG